ncbi:hypothetical protein TSH100_28640 [Azospirillum sp. TSH100]|uniref:hypothetical protein n=1 Tax=Azospirillum sp. TSH100 TaxID=652764 RepID=UPI000D6040A6|nr:hypothetical protein [Azospirillum sp. TSH100]PWC80905.1 hypothetical protein TSH100_28640 [Azospirillum sp. TSH100]QCG87370.1 hypothetical protein E6C72_06300 [Azospirillum sp. TSH100]
MPGCTVPATLTPPKRTASCAPAHLRTARRLPADGNRRPVTERCSHHSGCAPAMVPVASHNAAPHHDGSLWRTMMERWLAAAL